MAIKPLTTNGAISLTCFYQSPFTDYASTGLEGIFPATKFQKLDAAIKDFWQRAVS